MFSDKYGLTQAVLEGRKTMTRRIANIQPPNDECNICWLMDSTVKEDEKYEGCAAWVNNGVQVSEFMRHYKVGEVLAIAQRYKDIANESAKLSDIILDSDGKPREEFKAGWNNKMFVRADLMPHHIKITGIKVERLQDISDEDCLKEGVIHAYTDNDGIKIYHTPHTKKGYLSTDIAQDAFAFIINKISGKGTWEANPFTWAYEFKLID